MQCPQCKKHYNDIIEVETINDLGWCLECEEKMVGEEAYFWENLAKHSEDYEGLERYLEGKAEARENIDEKIKYNDI